MLGSSDKLAVISGLAGQEKSENVGVAIHKVLLQGKSVLWNKA